MHAHMQVEHVKAERNVLAEVQNPYIVKLIYSFQVRRHGTALRATARLEQPMLFVKPFNGRTRARGVSPRACKHARTGMDAVRQRLRLAALHCSWPVVTSSRHPLARVCGHLLAAGRGPPVPADGVPAGR